MEKQNKEVDEEKKKEIEANPFAVFLAALDNCKPLLKVIPVKKGGITYKCPVPMNEKEREFKSIQLILKSCLEKDRNARFYDALAHELIDAQQNQVIFFALYHLMQIKWFLKLNLQKRERALKRKSKYTSSPRLIEHMRIIDGNKFLQMSNFS